MQLDYAGWKWRLLERCDLARLADDLSDPAFEAAAQFGRPLHEILELMVERRNRICTRAGAPSPSRDASYIMLVVFDASGRAAGL